MRGMFSKSRILVTGGAGFIGSNICDALIEAGSEVVCLDNFLTGRRENIEHLLDDEKFTLIEGDIRDLETCQSAITGCTHICHQAALGSVPRSVEDPKTTNAINISGNLNVLIAAQEAGIQRFVFASSSSVYGSDATMPKIEHSTGTPLSPYAVTKMVNECYAQVFHQIHGMETIGSAERSTSKEEMKEKFETISEGGYAGILYEKFGKERVQNELEEFLKNDFFERSGGGIGMTRMIRAMKLSNLI